MPNPDPSPIRKAFNAYRLVKLLLLAGAILGAGNLFFTPQNESAHTNPPLTSTDDPITLTLTWDEWGDLHSCILRTQIQITHTLEYAPELLDSQTITDALETYARLDQLILKVDAAVANSYPNTSLKILDPLIESQAKRVRNFQALMFDLSDAEFVQFGIEVNQ